MNNFLNVGNIKIPIIQRDYVQGRENEKTKEIIENFLDDIFFALENNKNFHLDFIYGNYENDYFIPIDGQQRLTLLYLLFWYFSNKENITFDKELLYETRVSARDFCKILKNFEISFDKEEISSQIKNNKYFIPYWENDPTVKSMLNVIDLIHKKAKNSNVSFNDLANITFEIFELVDFEYKQAEELYRKMNSRGKPLTPFENFKAILEQIAFKKDRKLYKDIAIKFEKDWLDEFWPDNCKNAKKIDERFMNFIYFITEMRNYEINKNIENIQSFVFLKAFYQDKKNLKFLLNALDSLKELKEYSKQIEQNLVFFERKEKINFFEEIIDNYDKMTIANKILAYILLKSLNEFSIDILRIIRNDLHRERSLKTAQIEYASTIENKDIPKLIKKYNHLLEGGDPYLILLQSTYNIESMNQEKIKADLIINHGLEKEIFELEDFKYLKGDLGIFLDEKMDFLPPIEKIKFLHKIFPKLFEKEDNVICRGLLSYAYINKNNNIIDYSFWIGNILHGDKYFFGQKDKWEIFFTTNSQSKENINIYNNFFNDLQSLNIEEIIKNALNRYKSKNKDFIYYFLKYPIILTPFEELSNVIGWLYAHDNIYVPIEKLEKPTKITYARINVFLLAILNELKIKNWWKFTYINKADNLTFIEIKGVQVYIDNNILILYNKKNNYSEQFDPFGKGDVVEIIVNKLNTLGFK